MSISGGTRFALLGLLTIKPMTGYEMRKFIGGSIGHFWHESFGNIYPILHQLHKEGLVAVRVESGSDRPNRKVYSLTHKGRHAFKEWQRESASDDHFKSELMLKLFFGDQLSLAGVRDHLARYADQQAQALRGYAETRGKIAEASRNGMTNTFWMMTLRRGEMVTRARLAWARECLQSIEHNVSVGTSNKRSKRAARNGGRKS